MSENLYRHDSGIAFIIADAAPAMLTCRGGRPRGRDDAELEMIDWFEGNLTGEASCVAS
ncbi:hypothetical protein ACFXGI_07295 [Streptomyces sp. NPDC059355]|uniref:hypothetical protein n=1 Tax=Streptomyces sp. NPDC059355 TaxID=3346811 RepID=UPI0036A1B3AD